MDDMNTEYSLKTFLPLITIFALVIAITVAHQWYYGFNLHDAMRINMAAFFLVFAFFKIINLNQFAEAYAMYDLIAKRIYWYGYLYPFIEVALGLAYLFNWQPQMVNVFTICLMLIGAIGVFLELREGHAIMCACLGAVFKIPMTYVTLLEDLMTAAMAALMLMM